MEGMTDACELEKGMTLLTALLYFAARLFLMTLILLVPKGIV